MDDSKVDLFLDLAGEHHADLDQLVALKEDTYRKRLEALLADPTERDATLFETLQTPIESPLEAFTAVPVYQRNILWMNTFAQVLAACRLQAWSEVFGAEVIETIEANGSRIQKQADNMELDELQEASKKKDLKKRINKARLVKYASE
jgi:hypothetical protein